MQCRQSVGSAGKSVGSVDKSVGSADKSVGSADKSAGTLHLHTLRNALKINRVQTKSAECRQFAQKKCGGGVGAFKIDLDDEGNVLYMFKYQAGEFYMRYNEAATSMQLTFPYITDAEVDKIDLVRTACNDVNGVTPMTSAVYKVDVEGDTYKINIHIIAGLPRLSDLKEMVHTLRYTLNDCFRLRSMFCSHLKDIIEASNREQADDIEYEMASNERMKQIMASTEAMACEAKNHDAPVAADGITTLGEWFANCDIMPQGAQIQQIVCEGDDGYHFTSKDIDTITSYRLTEPIVHQLGADNAPTAETASIKIIFTIGEEADSNKHTVIVALEKAATIDKDKVTYIRINYITSNRAATSTATRIPAEVTCAQHEARVVELLPFGMALLAVALYVFIVLPPYVFKVLRCLVKAFLKHEFVAPIHIVGQGGGCQIVYKFLLGSPLVTMPIAFFVACIGPHIVKFCLLVFAGSPIKANRHASGFGGDGNFGRYACSR